MQNKRGFTGKNRWPLLKLEDEKFLTAGVVFISVIIILEVDNFVSFFETKWSICVITICEPTRKTLNFFIIHNSYSFFLLIFFIGKWSSFFVDLKVQKK